MFEQHDLEGLIRIFHIESKKELAAYCKKLTIFADDFASLILASRLGTIPYLYLRYLNHYIPEHLVPSDEEEQALRKAGPGRLKEQASKFASRVRQSFFDRRFLVGHLFCTPDKRYWYFFYHDQRDAVIEDNHWIGGSHIHLVNHFWPNLSVDALLDTFRTSCSKLNGSLHIRFDRQRRSGTRGQ